MTTVAELTTDDFKKLLKEFYAKPKLRSKMTQEEIKDMARRLNEKINVPLIKETGEEKILIKIILKIDNFLYDNLPNEFYDLVRNVDKGIDKKEAKRLVKRLTRLANKNIDIPYLPEIAEHFALKFVIGIIVKSAQKNEEFKKVRENSDKMKIPESDDDIESIVD